MPAAISRIGVDIRYSLLQFSRNKQSIFLTFVFPVILLIILGYLPGGISGPGYIDHLFSGILGLCILFSAVNETMGTIVRYRAAGLLKKLAVSPLSGIEWNLSRVITGTILVILSVAAALMVAMLVFGVRPDLNIISVSLIIAGSFISIVLGMVMAYLIEDVDSVNSTAFTLIIPLMFVSGSLFPVERLPYYMQFISVLSPLTYLNNGLRSSMFGGSVEYAATNLFIVIMLGFILFCICAAILIGKEGQS